MNFPLSPRRTFGIYAVVLAGLFLVYLSILSAGQRQWVVEKEPESEREQSRLEPDPAKPIKDLYEQLDASAKAASEPAPVRRPARVPPLSNPSGELSPQREQPRAPVSRQPEASGPRWVIQLGAFTQLEQANRVLLQARAKGFAARLIEPSADGSDPYFRVWAGRDFESPAAASATEERLKSHGIAYYLKKLP